MISGKLLKIWRKEKGLTQYEAAKALKIGPATYQRYEQGRGNPGDLRKQDIARRTKGAVPSDSWREE